MKIFNLLSSCTDVTSCLKAKTDRNENVTVKKKAKKKALNLHKHNFVIFISTVALRNHKHNPFLVKFRN
jgi:hypothetical protein